MRNATLEYLAAQAGAHRDRVAARYGPRSAQLRAAERAVVELDRARRS